MLQINQRLFSTGMISQAVYEQANRAIVNGT